MQQYARLSMALKALTDLVLFIFGISFIGLSRQLNRDRKILKLHIDI